jgi:hypothetical protein
MTGNVFEKDPLQSSNFSLPSRRDNSNTRVKSCVVVLVIVVWPEGGPALEVLLLHWGRLLPYQFPKIGIAKHLLLVVKSICHCEYAVVVASFYHPGSWSGVCGSEHAVETNSYNHYG